MAECMNCGNREEFVIWMAALTKWNVTLDENEKAIDIDLVGLVGPEEGEISQRKGEIWIIDNDLSFSRVTRCAKCNSKEVEFKVSAPMVLTACRANNALLHEYMLLYNYSAAKSRRNLGEVRSWFESLINWNCEHFHGLGVNAYLHNLIDFLIMWVNERPGQARDIIDILDDCRRDYFPHATEKHSAASSLAKAYFFLSRIPVAGAYQVGKHFLTLSLPRMST